MRKRTNAAWLGNLRGVRRLRHAQPGFTLIISLTLMMLLVVVAVGLLGLSTLTLRSGKQGEYAARARANARMALMLAIGDLQKYAGPDTRVTARADILDANNPPVLGVWKSWEGVDHKPSGLPLPYQAATKKTNFQSWLVSGSKEKDTDVPTTTSGTGTVALVGQKTVGEGSGRNKLEIHLTPIQIQQDSGKGAFAWWIDGENQKARLPKPYQPDGGTSGKWASVAKSHTVVDPLPFRMEKLLNDPSPADRAVSLSTSDFVGDKTALNVSQEFFYDLSTTSVGLLTNTATGGWRKDMSTLTENWASVPSSNLPFFRVSPGQDITYNKPTAGNPTPAKAMLYPWANYRSTSSSDMAIYRNGAVASWENLKEYALLYRATTAPYSMQTTSSGYAKVKPYAVAINGDAFSFIHRIRILPVIARIQWVFSYGVDPTPNPPTDTGKVVPTIVVNPVITMWNPYNVELTLPGSSTAPALSFALSKPLPVSLRATVGSLSTAYKALLTGSLSYPQSFSSQSTLIYNINSAFTLKPGQTLVFSAQTTTPAPDTTALVLAQGYRPGGGHKFSVLGVDPITKKSIGADPAATITMFPVFNTDYDDAGAQGVGIYLDMAVGASVVGNTDLAYRMSYTKPVATVVYQSPPPFSTIHLSGLSSNPVPFMSTIFGARTASNTLMAAKGFMQSSPFVMYTAMGSKAVVEPTIRKAYLGTLHPVNGPFDYSFKAHSSAGDDFLPPVNDATNSGYIVSGFQKSNGLTHCIIGEIPTRPLQSLCELQNWDLRFENPIPPFALNLIGNSDASPLIPAGDVGVASNLGDAKNLQYDDSYCANHLLFDDWFLSSIAPDPDSYGTSGRNVQTTYTDLLTGSKLLPNRAYHAIAEDVGASASNPTAATQIYTDHVKGATGWKTIASRLEVEGMFNVNSTSVTAWRALLGHARNQVVPFMKDGSVSQSSPTDHPVSRFSIAGDVQTGAVGMSGAFAGSSEFTGYRVFTDSMLDTLAQEVVKQVRLRGPFLSLSEFVNRQLSSGDLALAGAVQSALNQMAQGGSNPFSYLQANSADSLAVPNAAGADAQYQYPNAAVGKSAYGFPGWTRQADILRPLAPILSARDDTFVIRTHGDARDDDGNVVSSAVCEAIVRRTRDYVDPADAADITSAPASTVNQTFGRRFEVVSFRWLNPAEI